MNFSNQTEVSKRANSCWPKEREREEKKKKKTQIFRRSLSANFPDKISQLSRETELGEAKTKRQKKKKCTISASRSRTAWRWWSEGWSVIWRKEAQRLSVEASALDWSSFSPAISASRPSRRGRTRISLSLWRLVTSISRLSSSLDRFRVFEISASVSPWLWRFGHVDEGNGKRRWI